MARKPPQKPLAAEQRVESGPGNAGPTDARGSGSCVEPGALPSNTAPANYLATVGGTRVLRFGVDSLYLSFRGRINDSVADQLERCKSLAQSTDSEDIVQAVFEAGNHCFEVKPTGRGRYPFVLVDNWFCLQISRPTSKVLPMVVVQISSELLTRSGVSQAINAARQLVSSLGHVQYPVSISRADLCMDFETLHPLDSLPQSAWVTRAHNYQQYWEQGKYSGCTFGQGGDLMCRLYNKTLEIEKSKKTYLYDCWREAGWSDESTVWRLEFQFRRVVLKELGIKDDLDLPTNLEGLWKYAMNWLRLTLPDADTNQSRWKTHCLWEKLRDERWHRFPLQPLFRVSKSRVPTDERLFIHGLGSVTSFMAREGIQDIDEGFRRFHQAAQSYHLTRSQRSQKTLTGYVKEKVKLKSRKYNQLRDPDYREARAKAYRKGKEEG